MAKKPKNNAPKLPKGAELLAEKQPRANSRAVSKEVRADIDVHNFAAKHPVWQLGRIDDEGKWGWKNIGKERWADKVLPKLKNLESMTWAEIEKAAGGRRSGNNSHPVQVSELSKKARERLNDLYMDDLDELFSLRLQGEHRIYGKRIGNTLQIIWFDFNHEVYKVSKR